MNKSSNRINKIRINYFGNPRNVLILKAIRYIGASVFGWFLWQSENFFSGISPFNLIGMLWRWDSLNAANLLDNILKLSFIISLLIVYFFLTHNLINWLTIIDIPANKQREVFHSKTYYLDEKNKFSIKDIRDLIIGNSSYWGNLILTNERGIIKVVKFNCHSYKQNLQDYLVSEDFKKQFPNTIIRFRKDNWFTWQKIAYSIFFFFGIYFVIHTFKAGKELPNNTLGNIVKRGRERISQELRKQSEQKTAKERKDAERAKFVALPEKIQVTFDQIGGLGLEKKELLDNVEVIKQWNKYFEDPKKNKKPVAEPQHIILYGPPGTGKSLLIAAAAKKSGSLFAQVSGTELAESSNLKESLNNLFDNLAAISKDRDGKGDGKQVMILLLFDEIDRMGKKGELAGEELLTFLSGVKSENYKNIVIVAATNYLDDLDYALTRSGRLERKIKVGLPGPQAYKKIVELKLKEYYNEHRLQNPQLFTPDFVNNFTKVIAEEVIKDEYKFDLRSYIKDQNKFDIKNLEAMDEGTNLILFVGADIDRIIKKVAPSIMLGMGEKTLQAEHYRRATKLVYEDNKATPAWRRGINYYLSEEINKFIKSRS